MTIKLLDVEGVCRLILDGSLTFDFACEMEDAVIGALRRYTEFELDLSGVREIDLYGLHLLQILDTVAGDNLTTIAGSPLIEQTRRLLPANSRHASLGGNRQALAA